MRIKDLDVNEGIWSAAANAVKSVGKGKGTFKDLQHRSALKAIDKKFGKTSKPMIPDRTPVDIAKAKGVKKATDRNILIHQLDRRIDDAFRAEKAQAKVRAASEKAGRAAAEKAQVIKSARAARIREQQRKARAAVEKEAAEMQNKYPKASAVNDTYTTDELRLAATFRKEYGNNWVDSSDGKRLNHEYIDSISYKTPYNYRTLKREVNGSDMGFEKWRQLNRDLPGNKQLQHRFKKVYDGDDVNDIYEPWNKYPKPDDTLYKGKGSGELTQTYWDEFGAGMTKDLAKLLGLGLFGWWL